MSDQVQLRGAADDIDFETARSMVQHSGASVIGPGELKINIPDERSMTTSLPVSGSFSNNNNPEFRKDAILDYDTMKTICTRSSVVAPAVNFVCETLGGTPFQIRSVDGARVPQRDIKRATELFTQPMGPGRGTFPDLLTELCFDQMAMDHGIILKHGRGADMGAFEAMPAETFHAVPDRSGRLKSWLQKLPGDEVGTPFSYSSIVQFRRRPRTDSLYGRPPLEAVVSEVTALLNASKMFAFAMDRNEIPPGVLVMLNASGSGDTARKRFLQQIQQDPGYAQHYRMRVLGGSNLKDVKWINFAQNFHEMEVAILMRELQAVVWRNFGVDRLAMGAAQDINRSTAEEMVATRHYSLFKPILDLWANKFTFEVLNEINPNLFIEFIHYARTGSENDLGEDGSSQNDGQGGPGSPIRPTSRKACRACAGDGWIRYKDEGNTIVDQCPSCRGQGFSGPLFVSRPQRARVLVQPTSERFKPTDPDAAWLTFADARVRARLDDEVLATQGRLRERLETVKTYDDLVAAGAFVRDQLMRLFDSAYDLGSRIVKASGATPDPAPLRNARAHVLEVVRFELQETAASVLKTFRDPGTEGVTPTAERALLSASHLASFAPRLAGQVIAAQFV